MALNGFFDSRELDSHGLVLVWLAWWVKLWVKQQDIDEAQNLTYQMSWYNRR